MNGEFERVFHIQDTWRFSIHNNIACTNRSLWQDKTWERFDQIVQQFPEFSGTVQVNGQQIDCTRTVENIDWDSVSTGLVGACHGDLVVDNIIVGEDQIHYIDLDPELSMIFFMIFVNFIQLEVTQYKFRKLF